jgi:hypothetical protein
MKLGSLYSTFHPGHWDQKYNGFHDSQCSLHRRFYSNRMFLIIADGTGVLLVLFDGSLYNSVELGFHYEGFLHHQNFGGNRYNLIPNEQTD